MRLKVDVLPAEELVYPDVVLVVDVIRSTTTAVCLLEAGAEALYWVPSPRPPGPSRMPTSSWRGKWGLKPPGFDLGNSPREALEAPVGGKTVVMSTTNGTKAAHAAAKTAKHVLLASLFNAHAAARLARELATEEVAILCAGKEGRVGLDDLYTAGVLAEYLGLLGEVEPEDGARIALSVKRAYQDPLEALSLSAAAQALKAVGLEADVPFAPRWPEAPPCPSSRAGWGRPSSSRRPTPGRRARGKA